MRYFIQLDGSLAECLTEKPVNADNLPIVELDLLPAPFVYCKAEVIDGSYMVKAREGWEEEHETEVKKLVESSIKSYVLNHLNKRAQEKGFQNIDSAVLCAVTEGPYQALGVQFADLRDRAFQLRDNLLARSIDQENIETFVSEIDVLRLE